MKRLKNKHKDQDIYVIGSGSSLNHYEKTFFDYRITIGINRMYQFFKCWYTVIKHHELLTDARDRTQVIATLHDRCVIGGRKAPDWCYIMDTAPSDIKRDPYKHIKLRDGDKNNISVGFSTLISAMDVARWMGAKNIFLCGCECEVRDGRAYFDGYYPTPSDKMCRVHKSVLASADFPLFKEQMLQFCKYLKIHGVNVYSVDSLT